jgi:hypothetical protein
VGEVSSNRQPQDRITRALVAGRILNRCVEGYGP